MSALGQVISAVREYADRAQLHVERARADPVWGRELMRRWAKILDQIPPSATPTGLQLPAVALPLLDEPGAVARYLMEEGLPGEFPFVNGIYPRMYAGGGDESGPSSPAAEEPMRLFAGLGTAEETNKRFAYLMRHQRSIRLSTAFDGPTLYGLDSDADGVFGKIGEGGVAIDTLEDMQQLYKGFPLDDPHFSVSMTINGPAPILLAMYIAQARRRFGPQIEAKLRGTIQADILKEVQAQNEMIFPVEFALRFLAEMADYTTHRLPRWYPLSISGYHIAEAGATPVQQAAYMLANGFAYVESWRGRGMEVARFGPRLSFFLDCGLDLEYLALGRVCRKLWAVGMRQVFAAPPAAQRLKLHTQTSGRSLISRRFQNNLTRTAVELMLAYMNATNSCHSNSADEPFTTPSAQYVQLAANAQSILLEESGLFKLMTGALAGGAGMSMLQRILEEQILAEWEKLEQLGGVMGAMEERYQRSQIQAAAHRYERQVDRGSRPIIGLNRYADPAEPPPDLKITRTPPAQQRRQVRRTAEFKRKHARTSPQALQRLSNCLREGGNLFEELLQTVQTCTLGQITACLQEEVGKFRPMM